MKCEAKFAVERHVFITFAYRPAIVHSGSCLSEVKKNYCYSFGIHNKLLKMKH